MAGVSRHPRATHALAVTVLLLGCAGRGGATKLKQPTVPAIGPSYRPRLELALGKAPQAQPLVREYFDLGYKSSQRDFPLLREGQRATVKRKACLASVSALRQSGSLVEARVDGSILETMALGCEGTADLPEEIQHGLVSGRGPAYNQTRLRVVNRASELDPDNTHALRERVIESFEEGYRAGTDDRPGDPRGSLTTAERSAIVDEECSSLARTLEIEDLRSRICEVANRNFDRPTVISKP
jgi:hypothetical protein